LLATVIYHLLRELHKTLQLREAYSIRLLSVPRGARRRQPRGQYDGTSQGTVTIHATALALAQV
jgi:hypothetical protein